MQDNAGVVHGTEKQRKTKANDPMHQMQPPSNNFSIKPPRLAHEALAPDESYDHSNRSKQTTNQKVEDKYSGKPIQVVKQRPPSLSKQSKAQKSYDGMYIAESNDNYASEYTPNTGMQSFQPNSSL